MGFPLIFSFFSPAVRKGYRIQTDKDRDSMKVLYYVEKELAQFDPARRMRERCEKQAWFDFFFSTDLRKTGKFIVKRSLALPQSQPPG